MKVVDFRGEQTRTEETRLKLVVRGFRLLMTVLDLLLYGFVRAKTV
jgi:hypothetical protein